LDQRCHPEEGVVCPTKDLGEPRESPAHFAGEINRALGSHPYSRLNYKITQLLNFPKEFHAEE
jgi:hypothetical protein